MQNIWRKRQSLTVKDKKRDLTRGNVVGTMLLFAGPMILGNMLQQFYNIADSLIVGRALGADALAAVGSAYTLMTFLTSILIGLCMGSGALFSYYFGKGDRESLCACMDTAFVWIGGIAIVLQAFVLILAKPILVLLHTPSSLMEMMREYTVLVFWGIFFIFLYNYFAYLLRAVGNSVVPLYFLGISAVMNIGLDILFVMTFSLGIGGAALATVLSQAAAGIGIAVYTIFREPDLRLFQMGRGALRTQTRRVLRFSFAASLQQSVMNFGILMVQGLVNSFGPSVMAAFAAGVKIDTFAYMPAQEFGNAFSLFISQNFGAEKWERIKKGTKGAIGVSVVGCLIISLFVWIFAKELIGVFVSDGVPDMIRIGTEYLRIEGAFYCGIGILFLLYGYCRGINRPELALLLTIISLGTRVLLAYMTAGISEIGVRGIWAAIPIGWLLADTAGVIILYGKKHVQKKGALNGNNDN